MIKVGGNGQVDLVVPVNESFWTIFLGGRLDMRLVGQAVCFCRNDRAQKRQLIVVVPARDASRVPSIGDLRRAFPLSSPGRHLRDVREIPIPLYEFRQLTGVNVENVQTEDSEMIVLFANREAVEEVKFADSVLVGFQVQMDEIDESLWPKESTDYHVLFDEYYQNHGVHNLLMLMRSGTQIAFSPSIVIEAEVTGDDFSIFDDQPRQAAEFN
jgi:hypothetical protein